MEKNYVENFLSNFIAITPPRFKTKFSPPPPKAVSETNLLVGFT